MVVNLRHAVMKKNSTMLTLSKGLPIAVWPNQRSIQIRHGVFVDLVLDTQFCRCLGLCPFTVFHAAYSNSS